MPPTVLHSRSVSCGQVKEEAFGVLGSFEHLVDLLMWELDLVSSFFLKLSDSPVKYIVKSSSLFMVKGAKGYAYIVWEWWCNPILQVKNLELREVK